jgi:hypothetical protein
MLLPICFLPFQLNYHISITCQSNLKDLWQSYDSIKEQIYSFFCENHNHTFQCSSPGMSNWRPAGRMRPLCLFCAAQIGLLFDNNSFILLIPFNVLLKFVIKSPFLGAKNTVKSFLTTKFCKIWPAYEYFKTLRPLQQFLLLLRPAR